MILGPGDKKEISFGHHRMWKEVPESGLIYMHPPHTHTPPIAKVRGKLGGQACCSPILSPTLVPFLHSEVAAALRRALQTGGFS